MTIAQAEARLYVTLNLHTQGFKTASALYSG